MQRKREDLADGLRYGQLVYKYKLYPTDVQKQAIDAQLETARRLYNAGLADRMTAEDAIRAAGLRVSSERTITRRSGELLVVTDWKWASDDAKVAAKPFYDAVSLGEQKKRLITAGRKADPWLSQLNYGSCADCLTRLDKTFQAFYRRCKAGETPGFPRFKRRHEYGTLGYNTIGQGCKLHADTGRVYLHNVPGLVKYRAYRPIPTNAEVRNLSLTRQADGYWVCVLLETVTPVPASSQLPCVGIDLGYGWAFVMPSTGEPFSPERHYRESMERLAELQQSLETRRKPDHRIKQTASYRWKQTMEQVRKLHLHIRNQRHEWHIEVANALAGRYGTIYHEKLNIRQMVKRPDAKIDTETGEFATTGAEATASMRVNTLDMAWGAFLDLLKRQIEKRGGRLIAVDASNTTQECSRCHKTTGRKVELSDTVFCCTHCGHSDDRKRNAAQTILYRGVSEVK